MALSKPLNECRIAHCHSFVCLKCSAWVNPRSKKPHKCKNPGGPAENAAAVMKRKEVRECPPCRAGFHYWEEKPWQDREARDEFHLRGHDRFEYIAQHPKRKKPAKKKEVNARHHTNAAPATKAA